MILTGPKIKSEIKNGTITIHPFSASQLNPNSYDVRLGETILTYTENVLDTKSPNETQKIIIPKTGLVIEPNRLYLGHTVETIATDTYVPIVHGKSSTGRVGLFIHITADLVDIGYKGQYTLMLHATQPVIVYPNMRIGQITFWRVDGDIQLYDGKYQNGRGPQASEVYKDF